jgi:hypothetical protein
MDAVEKPMTGRNLGKCGRRCVAICVDPEGSEQFNIEDQPLSRHLQQHTIKITHH